MKEKFLAIYSEVFDSEGNVLLCGREKCQELIRLANKLETDVDHGDVKTGYMNVKSIQKLYKKETQL